MNKDALKVAVAKVKELLFSDAEAKTKWEDLTHISGWNDFWKSFSLVFWFGKRIVYCVEMVQKEYTLCTEAERIEVAAEVLDDLVEFKGWMKILEPFDDKLFRIILSSAVAALNGQFGNGAWYKTIGMEAITILLGAKG